jgi:two-component system cell cycle response regulator
MFEFREALDGEQAWEMLLIDPSIRVVISDLTMPKLDGYGLLKRIRSSKIGRIRSMPVVVVSGSDEQAERDRAKAAGATDLITKGIGTGQLLSRLDILSKLVSTQHEFERGLEALVQQVDKGGDHVALQPVAEWEEQAEGMRAHALRQTRNFVVLNACVGLKHLELDAYPALPPASVVNAIGQLLHRTVRQTDCVAQTGEIEFTIATGSIHFDSARHFAERVCRAIAHANLIKDGQMALIASCGVVSISEYAGEIAEGSLAKLRIAARERALLGLQNAITGVIGPQEELLLKQGGHLPDMDVNTVLPQQGKTDLSIDLATLLRWIKEGKEDQVLGHIGKLSTELKPLVDLLLKQYKT